MSKNDLKMRKGGKSSKVEVYVPPKEDKNVFCLFFHFLTQIYIAFVTFFNFLCMRICLHKCLCPMCVQCFHRLEEAPASPGTRVTEVWEPLCSCWLWYPVPGEEQLVLLTAEPSLPVSHMHIFNWF